MSGQQKAKEAIEREREKARLKKLEREKELNAKAQSRQDNKERRLEEARQSLDLALVRPTPSSPSIAKGGGDDRAQADSKARALASSPPTATAELAGAPGTTGGRATLKANGCDIEEALVRKLFALLDRGGKASISPRDVLVALKKHPQVRRLFGLPANNVEDGGDSLEKRLLAIQDAFEAGSGLGEVGPVFAELREGSGATGQSFGWEAFLASCQRGGLRATAAAAAALLPREHATGGTFVPTAKWREVPEGAACPGGLEYKMDMETGKTLARLPP